MVFSASPHRRQIKSSPSHRASNPTSAIVAGSSINSMRTRLSSVSNGCPSIQMRTRLRVHRVEKLGDLDDHLPSLPNHELLALESRQMLGHSRP
jgi:hypothetical protein